MTRHKRWPGLEHLLSLVPVSSAALDDLIDMMNGKMRHYHNVEHLTTLWSRHLALARHANFDVTAMEPLLACAIAYHDCVYVGGRRDNEDRSAEVWLQTSRDSGMDEIDRGWVAETIRATSDHLAYTPRADDLLNDREKTCLWLLDLDLTPLGEVEADFDRNTMLLRLEVPHLSDDEYDRSRLAFLRRFRDAPEIYRSPAIAECYDGAARANIARQLV